MNGLRYPLLFAVLVAVLAVVVNDNHGIEEPVPTARPCEDWNAARANAYQALKDTQPERFAGKPMPDHFKPNECTADGRYVWGNGAEQ